MKTKQATGFERKLTLAPTSGAAPVCAGHNTESSARGVPVGSGGRQPGKRAWQALQMIASGRCSRLDARRTPAAVWLGERPEVAKPGEKGPEWCVFSARE